MLGDSIVAYDYRQRRLTTFDRAGKVLPTKTLPVVSSFGLDLTGRMSCGPWLGYVGGGINPPGQSVIFRDTISLVALTASLERVAFRLGPFPGPMTVGISKGQGKTPARLVGLAPFGARLVFGVADSLIYTMDTATNQIVFWSCDGRRRNTIVVPLPERPIPPDAIRRLKQREMTSLCAKPSQDFIDAWYSPANLPKALPRVRTIVPGAAGDLWVEQYEADPEAASTWWVLDIRGRTLATLGAPAGFRIKSVTRDRVGGVFTDEDGVESLRIYWVIK